ncbi:16S rRNA (adenine(1518)-N(6)/adenine(1519)-N(6))-dimethyltransferase [Helicobacter sp. MIT 00-7814]|uniref:16S rRNA (adenine(1518)-N(6)/adenine(1519)-N(6))- dimethyltransferase RsmA n=1 Tax=unclassified Helicobacter TaxID=2593540 RepID=UPI000E1F8544|nr:MULTISPECIES: 16S rRNA (adenine(1518)-N(6)/adenine(1519)-N(6))-dimethyltransferase RsmA [unclassified Helicobacter]RDU54843.1 16S rRNA (adenine(1518)-N(6)/adenine(1519)-N(6))-dimethyltransferase [Helicobacter sp. MIT 99-10781]RDU54901.1 16S rRNA (adenine(1518)-N(6)/adenine(1519)-N(6))-dimethyltransferase [Helicobacter sp. MIT 00-7814]
MRNITDTHKAKKHFGQNFLKDTSYIHKIIQAIPNAPYKMVEIGIGLGDLTQELVKRDFLIAYEVDSDLCSLFSKNFPHLSEKLNLINADVLSLQEKQERDCWLCDEPYMLISNLPYYVATHIILRLLRDCQCRYILVMTQKEVAQKFCAKVGMREFCALSVLSEFFGNSTLLFDVPNTAFEPMPKVTSSVFCIDKSTKEIPKDFDIFDFESFLKLAFSAPRKKLSKNLGKNFNPKEVDSLFEQLAISPNARPNEVSTQQYLKIYQQRS